MSWLLTEFLRPPDELARSESLRPPEELPRIESLNESLRMRVGRALPDGLPGKELAEGARVPVQDNVKR
ncbi:hypothetical protein T484DRAFT_1835898 [Baffinella frigidus]|nr:hypothetical protein T484DRAFT_1835898 [Cryptophyta sp. CCMP2293]